MTSIIFRTTLIQVIAAHVHVHVRSCFMTVKLKTCSISPNFLIKNTHNAWTGTSKEWESWSGENTCLPLLWFRFNSWTCCHIWVEFVVGSCSCSDPFSPYPWVLLPSLKLTFYVLPGNSGQGEPPCGSHLLNSHYYPINLRFVLFGWVISQNKSTCLSFRQHICKPCKEMIKVMS